jgi:hypothetical protein
MSNFVNLEESSDRFDLAPSSKAIRKAKKHSLRQEIFVQLRLAGPEGRMVDPSKIPIVDPSESPMKNRGAEQFMSHVIVEFCNEQNLIPPEISEEPTEKTYFQLHFSALDEEEDEGQEKPTATTELEQNQQSETGPAEELNKKELVNESDLQNKVIEYIREAPELESPLPRRTRRNRNKNDIFGSPTSVVHHLPLDNTFRSPNITPRSKRPHLSRRSLLVVLQQQAPSLSASSRPRTSLLDKLGSSVSRQSGVAPSVEETTPES